MIREQVRPESVLAQVPEDWELTRVKFQSQINAAKLDERTRDDYEFAYIEISSVNADGRIGELAKETFSCAARADRPLCDPV